MWFNTETESVLYTDKCVWVSASGFICVSVVLKLYSTSTNRTQYKCDVLMAGFLSEHFSVKASWWVAAQFKHCLQEKGGETTTHLHAEDHKKQ